MFGRDCLTVAADHIIKEGWATADALRQTRQECQQRVEEAVAMVQREPAPDPYKETWCALASRHLSEGFTLV